MSSDTAPSITRSLLNHRGAWSWLAERSQDVRFAPRWWWAAIAVAVATAVHTYVAWNALGPMLAADEVSTIGAAQLIARSNTDWTLAGSGYMPGMATLLAPAWWFTDDPFLVYRVGLAMGVVLAVATIAPLAAIAHSVGVTSRVGAVALAAIVVIAPARALASNYVVSEQLLTLTTATLIAVGFRIAKRPTAASMLAFGALAVLPFLAHGRGVAVTAGACLWAIVVAWRNWAALGIFALTVTMLAATSWLYYLWIGRNLYWADNRLAQTFDGLAAHTVPEVAGTFLGLSWYLFAAWPAVGLIGIAVTARRFRLMSAEALFAMCVVPSVILALVQLDKDSVIAGLPRLDVWIYGRYLDHLFTIAALVGLAILTRVRARAIPVFVALVGAAIGAGFMLLTVPQIPDGARWAHVHVLGVVHMLSRGNYLDGEPEPWLLITIAAWAVSCLVVAAAWLRAAPLVLALLWTSLSLGSDAGVVDSYENGERITRSLAEPTASLPLHQHVGFDHYYGLNVNAFAFALHPRVVDVVTLDQAASALPAFYAMAGDTSPYVEYGALPYKTESFKNTWLWYFPGPTFDELDQQGRLAHPDPDSANE